MTLSLLSAPIAQRVCLSHMNANMLQDSPGQLCYLPAYYTVDNTKGKQSQWWLKVKQISVKPVVPKPNLLVLIYKKLQIHIEVKREEWQSFTYWPLNHLIETIINSQQVWHPWPHILHAMLLDVWGHACVHATCTFWRQRTTLWSWFFNATLHGFWKSNLGHQARTGN